MKHQMPDGTVAEYFRLAGEVAEEETIWRARYKGFILVYPSKAQYLRMLKLVCEKLR